MNTHTTLLRVLLPGAFLRVLGQGGIALVACLCLASSAQAEVTAAPLLTNGDFETAGGDGTWPAEWSRPKAGETSWETEDGGRFMRLKATAPGQQILVHRLVPLYPDVKAVEISLRIRVTDLVPGAQQWFDARIMTGFKNQEGKKLKDGKAIAIRKDTGDWVQRTVRFPVPEGAAFLELMPVLMQVEAGTLDIDDVTVTSIALSALEK